MTVDGGVDGEDRSRSRMRNQITPRSTARRGLADVIIAAAVDLLVHCLDRTYSTYLAQPCFTPAHSTLLRLFGQALLADGSFRCQCFRQCGDALSSLRGLWPLHWQLLRERLPRHEEHPKRGVGCWAAYASLYPLRMEVQCVPLLPRDCLGYASSYAAWASPLAGPLTTHRRRRSRVHHVLSNPAQRRAGGAHDVRAGRARRKGTEPVSDSSRVSWIAPGKAPLRV